jgi:hypothetical protein
LTTHSLRGGGSSLSQQSFLHLLIQDPILHPTPTPLIIFIHCSFKSAMTDDASRLFELSDIQLLTYFDHSYPQQRPWQICTLRSQMHSSLISALHRQRSNPASWQADPERPTNGGPNGWPFVETSTLIPASTTDRTPFRTSKFSRIGTALQPGDPPANPFDLKQLLKPLDSWDRRTKTWGPKTSD